MIEVEVRDGRAGRVGGPNGVNGHGDGELLLTIQRESPVDIGDELALTDGTPGEVIGVRDIGEQVDGVLCLVRQVVSVGTVFDLG